MIEDIVNIRNECLIFLRSSRDLSRASPKFISQKKLKKDTRSLKQRHNSTFKQRHISTLKQRHISTLIRFNKIEFHFNIEVRRCFNVNVVSTCICLLGDDLYLFGGQRSGSNLDLKLLTVSGPFLPVMVILHSCVDHIQMCTSIDFGSKSQRTNLDFRPLTIIAW